jgi:sucrose-6-phosphate hydrolase SacC (GH32 family)
MIFRITIVCLFFYQSAYSQIVSLPKERLKMLLSNQNNWKSVVYMEGLNIEGDNGMTWRNESMPYMIEITFEADGATDLGVKVLQKSNTNQEAIIGYNFSNEQLYINSINAGKTNSVDALGLFITPLKITRGRIKLQVFVQKNIIEVFANDGDAFLSSQVFPDENCFDWQIFVVGKANIAKLLVFEHTN